MACFDLKLFRLFRGRNGKPENYHIATNHQPQVLLGKLLVTDHDEEKKLSKLLQLRLHNPIAVDVLVENIGDVRNVSF